MVAKTLVPVDVAAGFGLLKVQPIPAGEPTTGQVSGILPVSPFKALTTMVSLMLVPTLVVTVAVFAATEKSLPERVALLERVTPMAALFPMTATTEFAA